MDKSRRCHPWEEDIYNLGPCTDSDLFKEDEFEIVDVDLGKRNWREEI